MGQTGQITHRTPYHKFRTDKPGNPGGEPCGSYEESPAIMEVPAVGDGRTNPKPPTPPTRDTAWSSVDRRPVTARVRPTPIRLMRQAQQRPAVRAGSRGRPHGKATWNQPQPMVAARPPPPRRSQPPP